MTQHHTKKYVRIVVFDDEPSLLVGTLRAIQKELGAEQNIQVQIQTYRMDWYYQAEQEYRVHNEQIPMLWLVDLHQRYKLDDEIRRSAQDAIDDLGVDARKAVNDLLLAASNPQVAEKLGSRPMTPDGAAVIAMARERGVPFLVASLFSDMDPTRQLLSKLATDNPTNDAGDWNLQKTDVLKNGPSRGRLKAKVANIAQPLSVKPGEVTSHQPGDRNFKEWYRKNIWAFWLGIIPTILLGLAAVIFAYVQLVAENKQVELATIPPTYKLMVLSFSSPSQGAVVWNLLDRTPLTKLPVHGQFAKLEVEAIPQDCDQIVLWHRLGADIDSLGPQKGRIDSSVGSHPRWALVSGLHVALLYSSNETLVNAVKNELGDRLKAELEPLRREIANAQGAWLCEGGVVRSANAEGEAYIHVFEELCRNLHSQFEKEKAKNSKISFVAFRVKPR